MHISRIGFSATLARTAIEVTRGPGLVLICGPTGSGKTDTAQALIHDGQSRGLVLQEFRSDSVSPVGVVDAGDLQDGDGVQRAVALATTCVVIGVLRSGFGRLVFDRLADMHVAAEALSRTNVLVLTQHLVHELCHECKNPRATSEAEFVEAGLSARAWELTGGSVYEPFGCGQCDRGYQGKLVLAEGIMKPAGAQAAEIETIARHAAARILSGQIALSEVRSLLSWAALT